MMLLDDMESGSANPSVPTVHIQPICDSYQHTHTPTHTSELLLSLQRSPLHSHPHTPQPLSALAHRLTSRFITHQISFRFAMKNQLIKNALNMRVVCLCGNAGSWEILHLDCLILCPIFIVSSSHSWRAAGSHLTQLSCPFSHQNQCMCKHKCACREMLRSEVKAILSSFH